MATLKAKHFSRFVWRGQFTAKDLCNCLDIFNHLYIALAQSPRSNVDIVLHTDSDMTEHADRHGSQSVLPGVTDANYGPVKSSFSEHPKGLGLQVQDFRMISPCTTQGAEDELQIDRFVQEAFTP